MAARLKIEGIETDSFIKVIQDTVISKMDAQQHSLHEKIINLFNTLEATKNTIHVKILKRAGLIDTQVLSGIQLFRLNKQGKHINVVNIEYWEDYMNDEPYWRISFPEYNCWLRIEYSKLEQIDNILCMHEIFTFKWYLNNTEGNIFRRILNWWHDIIM